MQDEKHVLLECSGAKLSSVRSGYTALLKCCDGQDNPMNIILRTGNSDDLAWFIHHCMREIEESDDDSVIYSNCEDGKQPEG